ncbi:NAD-binding protein [Streptomyces sp. NPDC091217]|uniref:NAD-binding protein n=1 Tax=Streptomyces sp. NPDC091217 TaxID=3365975 RepID=UPI00382F1DF3
MTAGDPTGIPTASEVLSGLGTFRHVSDDPGHAAVMKLATNLLAFATLMATSEALELATAAGIDRQHALELLEQGPATSALLTQRRTAFLDPDSCEVQGPIVAGLKVYDMIAAFADEVCGTSRNSPPAASTSLPTRSNATSQVSGPIPREGACDCSGVPWCRPRSPSLDTGEQVTGRRVSGLGDRGLLALAGHGMGCDVDRAGTSVLWCF